MEPITLRLQENTISDLDDEYGEYDFPNRTEYIRHILDARDVILENTAENTEENTEDLRERLDELEARVAQLEVAPADPGLEARVADLEAARADSRPRDPEGETPENTVPDGDTPEIGEILASWPGPAAEKREERRAVGAVALEWLRERDDPVKRPEFVEALLDDHPVTGQGKDTWWRKTVRPALQEAVDAGVVEFSEGNWTYEWVGPESA